MYTITMDGKPLFSPEMMSEKYRVLAPKASLDVNANGTCSFVLPPGHPLSGSARRRKSVVIIRQDGEEIFRGQVLKAETDTWMQQSVECEGVRGYLNDSQAAPYTYTGTPRGLLKKLINEHNEQMEAGKRFTLGDITVKRADEALACENVAYWETYREIDEKLLSAYGGYLRARMTDGVLYLDWLEEAGRDNPQKIRFAVNLLDIMDKRDAGDMFTILRPLGASEIGEDGAYSPPVTIASVNGGSDVLTDEEAVDLYGRIYKTHSWPHVTDPAELLEKAREYQKIGAELRTITLKAIDMHFLDGSAQAIRVGDTVHILSQPHGIDIEMVCIRIEIDIFNPEETMYTFGEAPRALTDNVALADEEIEGLTMRGGGGGGAKKELEDILRWAKIQVNNTNANILLTAGEVELLGERMSTAEIEIDGINAQILLLAKQEDVDDLGMRMSAAGIDLRGDISEIKAFATQETVDDLGTRMSGAELIINGDGTDAHIGLVVRVDDAESAIEVNAGDIKLKADKTYVDKLVADEIEAAIADVSLSIGETVVTDYLTVKTKATIEKMALDGTNVSLKSAKYVKSVSTRTRSVLGPTGTITVDINEVSGVSYDTIYYVGYDGE